MFGNIKLFEIIAEKCYIQNAFCCPQLQNLT